MAAKDGHEEGRLLSPAIDAPEREDHMPYVSRARGGGLPPVPGAGVNRAPPVLAGLISLIPVPWLRDTASQPLKAQHGTTDLSTLGRGSF